MRKYLIISLIIITILMIGMSTRNIKNEKVQEVISSPSYITDNTFSSKCMIAVDASNNNILYEKNIHQKMLPASLTKVLTCIVAIEHYNLDDYVVINYDMVNVEGSRIYLEVGDVISVRDLLYGLMLYSGNDAALALAYHYSGDINDFIILMNEVCRKLKMNNSIFFNPHGLDSTNQNLTTAYDLAILFSYCLKNNTFRNITGTKNYKCEIYSNRILSFRNKHRLIHSSPFATGGKTGVVPIFCVI